MPAKTERKWPAAAFQLAPCDPQSRFEACAFGRQCALTRAAPTKQVVPAETFSPHLVSESVSRLCHDAFLVSEVCYVVAVGELHGEHFHVLTPPVCGFSQ